MIILPDHIYMIRRKDKIDPRFFLFDLIERLDTPTALWTPKLTEAREFYSEESVETFMYEKLRYRPCEIIMVK